jgi:hypothetical protein
VIKPSQIALWIGVVALLPALAGPAQARWYRYGYGYGAYPVYRHGYYRGGYPVNQYDSGGALIDSRDLGWQPGPPGTAPANPCTLGLAYQNRC